MKHARLIINDKGDFESSSNNNTRYMIPNVTLNAMCQTNGFFVNSFFNYSEFCVPIYGSFLNIANHYKIDFSVNLFKIAVMLNVFYRNWMGISVNELSHINSKTKKNSTRM